MGLQVKNFYGKINGQSIYDFSRSLNYRITTPEERIELVKSLMYDENGNLEKYFEEIFTQKFDLKSENLYEDLDEELDLNVDRLTFTGANVSNVKLILSKEDSLYSETNIAKELEKIANYIIFSAEKEPSTEYKIYKDEKLFNRILKETNFGEGSNEEIDNTIHMLLEKNQNFKLEAKQKVFKEDILTIPILQDYKVLLDLIRFKLRKIAMLEKMFGKTKGFTKLDEITYEDKCYIEQFNLKEEELNIEMYKEVQKQKTLLQKHSALIKQDMLDTKDCIKGTIYFKQPLSDSTKIDYDMIDWNNEKHIEALLRIPPKGEDLQQDMVCIQYDLEKLISEVEISKEDNKILNMFREGFTLEFIGNKLGITKQSVDYHIKKIVKKLINKYNEQYEDWYYREVEKGQYKTCSKCKKVKLLNNRNFSQRKSGSYYNYCRDCG